MSFIPLECSSWEKNRPSVRGMEDDIRSLIETLRVEVLPEIDSN